MTVFRTEQHRLSRCDLARGWWPKVAGRTRTIPAHRRPDRYLGIWQPRSGSERPRTLTLTDGNGCLRHCAGCQQSTLKKPPDGRARQMAIARSKKAEGVAAY
ncbi:hypothetical protein T05_2449 [Trichinella murrelli]|uniref:Uncharacterized protein n=1 Tax=Trichinella murrelli TaxID=144512 RepID=A0A0V0T6F5_9BILA|nr:hypothetical protein T05_2449 [Trichinella murrelli]